MLYPTFNLVVPKPTARFPVAYAVARGNGRLLASVNGWLAAERGLFLINSWVEMSTVPNELARTMGLPDFYPFVMSGAVVKKLQFIHRVVESA